jgi:multidrug efflux pump subunit AcrA (membrane-fusion protein)
MSNSPIANIDDKTSLVLGKRNDNFLAKAILLEEATPPSYMRATIKLATYSLVIFLIWSFFANLDVVANAAGQVNPIQSVKILQHVDGGRISAINVVDGQRVVEGQVLMRFNATEATVEFETLNVKFWGLFAKVESLRALLEAREPDYSRVPKQYSQLVADQRRTLMAARKQIDQIGAEIKILTEVSSIRGGLAQEKLATRVQALDAERSVGQAQAELLRYRKANMDDLAAS